MIIVMIADVERQALEYISSAGLDSDSAVIATGPKEAIQLLRKANRGDMVVRFAGEVSRDSAVVPEIRSARERGAAYRNVTEK